VSVGDADGGIGNSCERCAGGGLEGRWYRGCEGYGARTRMCTMASLAYRPITLLPHTFHDFILSRTLFGDAVRLLQSSFAAQIGNYARLATYYQRDH